MAPFNITIFDIARMSPDDCGQPAPPEDGGVDYAVIGGAVGSCILVLAALAVAISKNSDRVELILQRITELLTALTNALRARAGVAPPLGRGTTTPLPTGNNLTDSFIVAYQARARAARMSYV